MREQYTKLPGGSEFEGYRYLTKHGIGPGTLPKDVTLLKCEDLPNYFTAIYLDRFLTKDELDRYDIYPEWIQKEEDIWGSNKSRKEGSDMKQYIKAADVVIDDAYIDDIKAFAASHGYIMSFNSEELEFEFTPETDETRMPVITAYADDNIDEDVIWFIPEMGFPPMLADLDYADSYEYYMEAWLKASKICTYLNEHPYKKVI